MDKFQPQRYTLIRVFATLDLLKKRHLRPGSVNFVKKLRNTCARSHKRQPTGLVNNRSLNPLHDTPGERLLIEMKRGVQTVTMLQTQGQPFTEKTIELVLFITLVHGLIGVFIART